MSKKGDKLSSNAENLIDRPRLRSEISAAAVVSQPFVLMNTFSAIVASYGLIADSTAVVIGAMLIAVLLGPIMGIALAVVDGNVKLLRAALIAESVGAGLVLLVGFTVGILHSGIALSTEVLSRTSPNLFDLAIALAAGAAGAFATVSPRFAASVAGAAISTALVPPLAACGICLSRGQTELAGGAILLFATNIVAIQIASSMVLYAFGFHNVTIWEKGKYLITRWLFVDLALFIVLCGFLFFQLSSLVANQRFEAQVVRRIRAGLTNIPGAYLSETRFVSRENVDVVVAVVRVPNSITPDVTTRIEKTLPIRGKNRIELHIRSLLTKETTSAGYLHETAPSSPPVDSLPNEEVRPTTTEPDSTPNGISVESP